MFCKNCGAQLPDGTVFCPNCGTKVESEQVQAKEPVNVQVVVQQPTQQAQSEPTPQPQNFEKQSNGMAVCGLIFAFVFPLLGFIFSCIGLGRSNKTHSGRGPAIAGIILSIVFTISQIISLVVIISAYIANS